MRKTLAVLAVAAASQVGTQAQAVIIQFEAIMAGINEVPANASPATGFTEFDYDTVTDTLTMTSGAYNGLLAGATAAHVHMAPVGVNGGIIIPITIGIGTTTGLLTMAPSVLTPAQETALFSAGLYVNVHSNLFPGGEIRGQILQVPTPGALAVLGLAGLIGARRRRN